MLTLRVGAIYFFYALLIGLAVQLWWLPHWFPQWHAGDGLLMPGDWLDYHPTAAAIAQRIQEEGWSVWQLRPPPRKWLEAGLLSALYAVVGVSKPWVLLPINAVVHAGAGMLFFSLLRHFAPEKPMWAFLSTLPFIVFPSSLIWVAQIHKDGGAILGGVLFLLGWTLLGRRQPKYLWGGAAIVSGCLLSFVVRPYLLPILLLLSVLFALLLTLTALFQRRWHLLYSWLFVAALFPLAKQAQRFTEIPRAQVPFLAEAGGTGGGLGQSGDVSVTAQDSTKIVEGPLPPIARWEVHPWVPQWLETKLYTLSAVRKLYTTYKNPQSNVDAHVQFNSVGAILRHLPRTLIVGLFAPFPSLWTGQGSAASSTAFRRVVGLEMLVVYLCFPFLLFFIAEHRHRPELWMVLLFCLTMLIVHSLTIPNMGTLHRVRYLYLMLLVGLGVSGGFSLASKLRSTRRWSPQLANS